jgi:hypothetical protein
MRVRHAAAATSPSASSAISVPPSPEATAPLLPWPPSTETPIAWSVPSRSGASRFP